MGFLDDLLSGVDGAISKLDAAAQKVEDVSEGVNSRIEQIADAPSKATQAFQSGTSASSTPPSETT